MIDEFDGGANAVTREDVREFYDSDECSRVSWVFFSSDNAYFVGESEYRAMANRAYAALLECTSYAEMKKIVARYTLNLSNDEIENGFCLSSVGGIGTSDRELCRRAAELSPLEISEIIETEDGLYILIGLNKSTSYYESHYEAIYDLCLENKLYSAIDSAATEMLASAAFTDTFRALTPADFFGEAAQ